jgi:hypothetical protein
MCKGSRILSQIIDSTVLQLDPECPVVPIDARTMLPLLTKKAGPNWPIQQLFTTPGGKELEDRQHLAVLSASQVVSRNLGPQMLTEGSSPAIPAPCQASACESIGHTKNSQKSYVVGGDGQQPRRGATRSLFGSPDRGALDSFFADAEQRVSSLPLPSSCCIHRHAFSYLCQLDGLKSSICCFRLQVNGVVR